MKAWMTYHIAVLAFLLMSILNVSLIPQYLSSKGMIAVELNLNEDGENEKDLDEIINHENSEDILNFSQDIDNEDQLVSILDIYLDTFTPSPEVQISLLVFRVSPFLQRSIAFLKKDQLINLQL